jgi:hypothetical protein
MDVTPTALTLRHLCRAGYLAEVVERWLPIRGKNIRTDLFGIGDLLALTVGEPPLLVQATTLVNLSARVTKARASAGLAVWLRTGSRFEVFGWRKDRATGRWVVKIVELRGEEMEAAVLSRPPRRRRARLVPADLFAGLDQQ